jgi:hypothetical protein
MDAGSPVPLSFPPIPMPYRGLKIFLLELSSLWYNGENRFFLTWGKVEKEGE